VACDRCLADLEMPIETFFDETYTAEGDELDLRQDIYDYICTALLQSVHDRQTNIPASQALGLLNGCHHQFLLHMFLK
jgi:hypothetical protein